MNPRRRAWPATTSKRSLTFANREWTESSILRATLSQPRLDGVLFVQRVQRKDYATRNGSESLMTEHCMLKLPSPNLCFIGPSVVFEFEISASFVPLFNADLGRKGAKLSGCLCHYYFMFCRQENLRGINLHSPTINVLNFKRALNKVMRSIFVDDCCYGRWELFFWEMLRSKTQGRLLGMHDKLFFKA